MRKLILLGSLGMAMALGAANAYALPPNSPYAIWTPQAVDQGMAEGRAAYVDGNGMALTQPGQSPEDFTYYSRGR